MAKKKTENPKGVVADKKALNELSDKGKSYLEKMAEENKTHASNYSKENTLSDTQEIKHITQEKSKIIRTRKFKNGEVKKELVGSEKIVNGERYTVFNWGIDEKQLKEKYPDWSLAPHVSKIRRSA